MKTIYLHSEIPKNPQIGQFYMDRATNQCYIWTGAGWSAFSSDLPTEPKDFAPTEKELDEHASLKSAWEEYLIIRKLLGI